MRESQAGTERLREAFAAQSDRARPTAACPAPERIWAAVRETGSRRAAREVALHAISCPACAESWRLAGDVAADALPRAIPEAGESATLRARALRLRWALGAAAAIAAVALGVAVIESSLRDHRAPVYRSARAGAVASLVQPGSKLPRSGFVLRWSGPEGARYDVTVGTVDLRPLAEARSLGAAEYRVPPDALAGLPRGARVLWRVEAELPDGRRVSSTTYENEVE